MKQVIGLPSGVMMVVLTIFILLMSSMLMNGCATVKPYQREYLADRIMDFDSFSEETAMERHFLETREGSSGGKGGAGGGFACN